MNERISRRIRRAVAAASIALAIVGSACRTTTSTVLAPADQGMRAAPAVTNDATVPTGGANYINTGDGYGTGLQPSGTSAPTLMDAPACARSDTLCLEP